MFSFKEEPKTKIRFYTKRIGIYSRNVNLIFFQILNVHKYFILKYEWPCLTQQKQTRLI